MADMTSREPAAVPEGLGATPQTRDAASGGSGATSGAEPPEWKRTGLRSLVLGSIVTVLAPLGGFLAGTMVGRSGYTGFEPMFAWMFGGLAVGAAGAFLAFTGGLRWVRANRRRL